MLLIFSTLTYIIVFLIFLQNETPKCINEIMNWPKHFSLVPNQNEV